MYGHRFLGYGRYPIPHVHGMTIGELALMFNKEIKLSQLKVIKAINWTRDQVWVFEDKPIFPPWIPPSPNLPTRESTLAYVGSVFIEATTASEGRGTTTPFTMFGAPFIDALDFAKKLNINDNIQEKFTAFRATYFQPTFFKYNGTTVAGAQWIPRRDNQDDMKLFQTGIDILIALRDLASPASAFQWDGSWFGHPGSELIDEYMGTTTFRTMMDLNYSAAEICNQYQDDVEHFKITRKPYLLY